ncbi:MAG: ATP-binding protein [Bacteroidota bacterium]
MRFITKKIINTIDSLVLDDFAFKKLSPQMAEYLYTIVDERYAQRSIIFTSNRAKMTVPVPVMANTIMDKIAHGAHQITIN